MYEAGLSLFKACFHNIYRSYMKCWMYLTATLVFTGLFAVLMQLLNSKWVIFLAMTQVSGSPRSYTDFQTYPSFNEDNQVVYEFRYAIDEPDYGVINDRWEHRIGQFVKGAYSLLEPSGKIRTVNYEVDGHKGFTAVVETKFPASALLSTQQFYQSKQKYPEPEINKKVTKPIIDPGNLHRNPDAVPLNFHAISAAYGFPGLQQTQQKRQTSNFPRSRFPKRETDRFRREYRKRIPSPLFKP